MTPTTVTPSQARQLMAAGAILIDVRGADEFARERIPGARNVPVDQVRPGMVPAATAVVFHCRTGMRTAAHADRLADAVVGPCHIITGGLDAWRADGLPIEREDGAPIEIIRQVHLAAGGLILLSVLAGALVAPGWFALAGLVGAGLTFAGATGFCGLAHLLALMPWNRGFAAR